MARSTALLLLGSLAFAPCLAARADYLAVSRNAWFRSTPESGGDGLVKLEPGDCVELIGAEQIDGYYHVALASGDEGWIYRSLARRWPDGHGPSPDCGSPLDEPPGPTQPDRWSGDFTVPASVWPDGTTSRERELIVCSWNIKWFGSRDPERYRLDVMADFLEECDVAALQEVKGQHDREVVEALVALIGQRGPAFNYRISARTGYQDNTDTRKKDYTESFAYLWNSARVRMVGDPTLASSNAINHDVFRQVPYVADFEVTGGAGFDFRVLTTHTTYNAAINWVRREEIAWITDWMTDLETDGERNLVAIGDFNANPPNQSNAHWFSELVPVDGDFRVLLYESAAAGDTPVRTTVPQKDASSNPDYHRKPEYDHVLVTRDTAAALPVTPMSQSGRWLGIWAFDDDPYWDSHGITRPARTHAVSDHRPVWFKLDYLAEDEDPDP
jgi:endonuclease/exonuclease/phosphatase family metal-dependent hydrolase